MACSWVSSLMLRDQQPRYFVYRLSGSISVVSTACRIVVLNLEVIWFYVLKFKVKAKTKLICSPGFHFNL